MQHNFFTQFVDVLFNTLTHSLWLGLLLALFAALVILFTRHSRPTVRYNLLISGLALFTIALFIIFVLGFVEDQPVASYSITKLTTDNNLFTATSQSTTNSFLNVISLLLRHADTIVLLWSVIVLIRMIRLFTGLKKVNQLRITNVSCIAPYWEKRLSYFAVKLGVHRMVHIAESAIVRAPMVIGHLKPLILLPAGLITSLSPENIEAILIHELAHIRRNDYLLNLLIALLETLFFFHPAIHWLARLIRTERENCCDELALAYTGNKTQYIKTLVACEEYEPAATNYAMGFTSSNRNLLARVQRLLSNRNPTLSIFERTGLLMAVGVAIILFAAFKDQSSPLSSAVPNFLNESGQTDTIKKPVTVTKEKSRTLQQTRRSSTTEDTLNNYTELSEPIKLSTLDAGRMIPINPIKTEVLQPGFYERNVYKSNAITYQGSTALKQQYAAAKLDSLTTNTHYETKTTYTPADQYAVPYKESGRKYAPPTFGNPQDVSNHDRLVAALVQAHIISSAQDLFSFKLSNKEFIVNGKAMPENIFQEFKNAFVPATNNGKIGEWSWTYNYESKTI